MNYFTSDTHFGHANIIRYCERPFDSVEAMDAALLKNWNERVTDEDDVYILGDLMFYCKEPEYYLERLKGRKHLILGNHDRTWMHRMEKAGLDYAHYFASVQDYLEVELDGRRLVLCHYPLMSWNEMGRGSYLLFGHIHNSVNAPYWPLLRRMERALNVGVDVNGFRPVTFGELVESNRNFREAHPPAPGQENGTVFL